MNLSICIATFNGENYILEQINSILPYIYDYDEIIISDDCSTDKTIELVLANFKDSRIKILNNLQNVGHVKNFERAIKSSDGDIILLCDQDDIWKEDKISHIRETFIKDNELVLLYHDFDVKYDSNIISFNFLKIKKTYFRNPISFLFEKVFKMDVWGCTIAFRKSLLNILLPFPSSVFAHDHYISVSAVFHGKILSDPNSLLIRRIHSNNLTKASKTISLKRIQNIIKTITVCSAILNRKIIRFFNEM
jgi:glycosyltransferase involved in cell wall biosynthesis